MNHKNRNIEIIQNNKFQDGYKHFKMNDFSNK